MRKFSALVLAAGLMVSMAACSSNGPASVDGCTPSLPRGGNAALVSAEGTFGKDPGATFPTPLVAEGSSTVHVISGGDGSGMRVTPGAAVELELTIYNGTTGAKVIATEHSDTGLLRLAVETKPAFGEVTQCARVGSRVAAVGTAGALIGEEDIAKNNLTLTPDETIVMVVDVQAVYLGRADGADQIPEAGLPSIVLAPDGRPGFTFASPVPPTDLKISELKQGDGARVKEGDRVVLNYTGVIWETGDVFDSTWTRDAPAVLPATSMADGGGGLVPGFAKALIGQRVGSQVIAVIPPKFGYPDGQAPATVPSGSTMVFVFDVLGIE